MFRMVQSKVYTLYEAASIIKSLWPTPSIDRSYPDWSNILGKGPSSTILLVVVGFSELHNGLCLAYRPIGPFLCVLLFLVSDKMIFFDRGTH